MKRPPDPALDLAHRIAAGEQIDLSTLRDADPALARGLNRVATIARALSPATPAGRTWGHLQQLELAGSGSFGDVYRAYDPALDRVVALKLKRTDAPSAVFSGRDFVAEAQRLARVRHPNVLAVHGASYHDDRAGIWTDWIEGETLHARLVRDGPLTHDALIALAQQLADALVAVHAAGLVHGDVKAGNVMLDRAGHAVLTDFGAGFKSSDEPTLAAGTPRYLAPEVVRGEAASPAVDVYALGVLLHRMATGTHAEAGTRASGVESRALRRLIAAMLDPSAAVRPSAAQVATTLRAIQTAPLRRARRALSIAVAAALATIAIVSLLAYRRAETLRLEASAALERAESANAFLADLFARAAPDAMGPVATLRDVLDAAPAMVDARYGASPSERQYLFEVLMRIESDLANDELAARHAIAAAAAAAEIDAASDDALRLAGDALRLRAIAGEAPAVLHDAERLYGRAQREAHPPALVDKLAVDLAEVEYRVFLLRGNPGLRQRAIERLDAALAGPVALEGRVEAHALRRLANLRFETGDHAAGIATARRSVEVAERELGAGSAVAALNRRGLAWFLMDDPGGAAEAEQVFRRNQALYDTTVGEDSRTWVDDAIGLAYALVIQDRAAEALPWAQRAAELAPKIYGRFNRAAFDARLTLADALAAVARHAEAESELVQLREDITTLWGTENRHYLLATRQLARLLVDLGRSAEAQPLFARCASDGDRILGRENPVTVECRDRERTGPE
jgi:hypothetical protein